MNKGFEKRPDKTVINNNYQNGRHLINRWKVVFYSNYDLFLSLLIPGDIQGKWMTF